MTNSHSDDLRRLTAKLSDGSLSEQESAQLNELLKKDSIAQEQFLDHLMIDALLEREFAGTLTNLATTLLQPDVLHKPTPRSFVEARLQTRKSSLTQWMIVPLFLLIVGMGAGGWYWLTTSEAVASQTISLADAGFENDALKLKGHPAADTWYGDSAEIVGSIRKSCLSKEAAWFDL